MLAIVVGYFFYKGYRLRAGNHFSRRVLLAELVRTPVTALLIGLPLLASLSWTFGVAHVAYGTLNLMTSTPRPPPRFAPALALRRSERRSDAVVDAQPEEHQPQR